MTAISFCTLFLVSSQTTVAQTFVMDGSDIQTCSGFFTDSGGDSGAYQNDESLQTTICSDGSVGTHVRLQFFQVDIDALDLLCFYDGPSTAAPSLDCHIKFTDAFIIQATAANPTGCITVTFDSDASGTDAGWYAAISCVASCQLIRTSMEVIDPPVAILDTGYNFIDVCPGQQINLSASGIYPQNNLNYAQDDSSSTFFWDFGNGNFASGSEVSTSYPEPGGYELQVRITDTVGCISTNYLNTFVRVSGPPTYTTSSDLNSEVCPSDTVSLRASVGAQDSTADISVVQVPLPYLPGDIRSDSLPLPDGNGVAYETSILLTEYLPGAVLENVLDLFGICIVMEHSWLRDLLITITCPSGVTTTLQEHLGNSGTEVFLGEPYEDDEGMEPIPGVGYEYCWTPTATNGTWLEYVQATGTDELPAGDYASYDPLDNLLGCPLNGEWTITIEDLWGFDNGYVFSWGISLNPDLLANKDSFFVGLVDHQWISNQYAFHTSADSIAFSAPNAGQVEVPFQTTDAFGCVFDTVFTIDVRSPLDPECYTCPTPDSVLQDRSICPSDTIQFDATTLLPNTDSTVTYEFVTTQEVPAFHELPSTPLLVPIEVTGLSPAVLANPFSGICRVCFTLETPLTSHAQVWLQSPGGQLLELSNFNGNGQDFVQTCFEPTASQPLSAGDAPFTGVFAPDGSWSALTGSSVNGSWNLMLSDTSGEAVLRSWSICFGNDNNVVYQWTPQTGVSCSDCPDPLVYPDFSDVWVVEAEDRYGCLAADSALVEIKSVLNTPLPDCSIPDEGQLLFSWPAVPGAAQFFVSVNNAPWEPSNGALSHLVSGLADGETVTLLLTTVPEPDFCSADTASVSCQYIDPCQIELSVTSVTPTSCYNSADGSVILDAQGNLGPVVFSLVQTTPFQNTPAFNNLPPGNYLAVAQDSAACTDTITLSVDAPDTLKLEIITSDVVCYAEATGSVQGVVTNAQGAVTYQWTGPGGFSSQQAFETQLPAGVYCLEVTDGNACVQSSCDTLLQPLPLSIDTTLSTPFCNDSDEGAIAVTASGGTPAYGYSWNDPQGSTGPLLQGITAGLYTLTLTDAAGCEAVFPLTLSAPPPLLIDEIIETQVSCNGLSDGALLVKVSGGTGPYGYSWSDPAAQQDSLAASLAEGLYQVTVSDANGCSVVGSAVLEAPDSIEVQGLLSSVSCHGDSTGSITVILQGGTSPYQLFWPSGLPDTTVQTGLPAGLYPVVVTDASGCQGGSSFIINQPPPLTVSVIAEAASCSDTQDGTASASVAGGTSPYEFAWSHGPLENAVDELAPGTYFLTITDALGCQLVSEAEIEAPLAVTGIVQTNQPACFGGSDASLEVEGVSGTPPFLYSLGNTLLTPQGLFGNLSAGQYEVVVQDANGCEWRETVEIEDPPPLLADAGPDITISLGDSVILEFQATGAQGTVQPLWTAAYSGTLSCDTCLYCPAIELECPSPVAKPTYTISYTISLVDENGCRAEDLVKVSVEKNRAIYVPTGFTPNGDGQNDLLIVHGQKDARVLSFSIYDRWGERVFTAGDYQVGNLFTGWDGSFSGQPMPAGIYVWYLEAEFIDGARLVYQGESTLIR